MSKNCRRFDRPKSESFSGGMTEHHLLQTLANLSARPHTTKYRRVVPGRPAGRPPALISSCAAAGRHAAHARTGQAADTLDTRTDRKQSFTGTASLVGYLQLRDVLRKAECYNYD